MWASGDFAAVAARMVIVAEHLCDTADLHAGWRVLDVATGSGNAAIAAARLGCTAVGIDSVPALLERGRERAAAEGLDVTLLEEDAEALPFADASFDAVTSVFGCMFAPDHAPAARPPRPRGHRHSVRLARGSRDRALAVRHDHGRAGDDRRIRRHVRAAKLTPLHEQGHGHGGREAPALAQPSRGERDEPLPDGLRDRRGAGHGDRDRVGWGAAASVLLAVALAFLFGYALTALPLIRARLPLATTARTALASDTASIAIMELVDNAFVLLVPGAIDAELDDVLFWASLLGGFVIAWPVAFAVNRALIRRGRGHAVMHAYHGH